MKKRKKRKKTVRKEAAGKRRATLCMYGFVGDFKLKLVNGDGDDATREARTNTQGMLDAQLCIKRQKDTQYELNPVKIC